MRRAGVSMRALGFAVLLIAVDFAAIRLGIAAMTGSADLMLAIFGILPLANVLAIGSYLAVSRRAGGRPFLVGFGLAGLAVILAWFDACMTIDDGLIRAFADWMVDTVDDSPFGRYVLQPIEDPFERSMSHGISFLAFYIALSVPPQLLVSLLGGGVAHWLAATRRPAIPA